ncbi:MAG: hypothetical protein ACFFEE_12115 [Candidatus Thorarchaeota archaeon]
MKILDETRGKEIFALLILSIATIIASLKRFGWVYPDSSSYLLFVEYFQGTLPGNELIAPFCYRPLLPLMVALTPISPLVSFPVYNLLFEIMLSWVFFYIAREFDFSILSSLAASGVCSFSFIVAFYGTAVLVDAGSMLFLALAMLLMLRGQSSYRIAVLLTVGILFKETAIIGILAYILYRRSRDSLIMIIPVATYLLIRYLTPSANPGYLWNFHLETFTIYFIPTMTTFLYALFPFVLMCIPGLLRILRGPNRYTKELNWLIISGIPALGYLGAGLFLAHFDCRFIWPLYIALVPLMAAGATEVLQLLGIERTSCEPDDSSQE